MRGSSTFNIKEGYVLISIDTAQIDVMKISFMDSDENLFILHSNGIQIDTYIVARKE